MVGVLWQCECGFRQRRELWCANCAETKISTLVQSSTVAAGIRVLTEGGVLLLSRMTLQTVTELVKKQIVLFFVHPVRIVSTENIVR